MPFQWSADPVQNPNVRWIGHANDDWGISRRRNNWHTQAAIWRSGAGSAVLACAWAAAAALDLFYCTRLLRCAVDALVELEKNSPVQFSTIGEKKVADGGGSSLVLLRRHPAAPPSADPPGRSACMRARPSMTRGPAGHTSVPVGDHGISKPRIDRSQAISAGRTPVATRTAQPGDHYVPLIATCARGR
jgi:hypothetical protein